jgi:hypothetical protein
MTKCPKCGCMRSTRTYKGEKYHMIELGAVMAGCTSCENWAHKHSRKVKQ